MPSTEWHSRGYLPHWEAGEIAQSITFRLADSLPIAVLELWREELQQISVDDLKLERRKRIEKALDQGYGSEALKNPAIGRLVQHALPHFDGSRYRLHAWVIMPNHVHVLATPIDHWTLSTIAHAWKSFTSRKANALLSRQGRFWAPEYFDRAIRDERHYANALSYIELNPVTAGLCNSPADWPFSSASTCNENVLR